LRWTVYTFLHTPHLSYLFPLSLPVIPFSIDIGQLWFSSGVKRALKGVNAFLWKQWRALTVVRTNTKTMTDTKRQNAGGKPPVATPNIGPSGMVSLETALSGAIGAR